MFDLTSALTPKEGRDIEAITNDILEAKRRGGEAILLGKRIEALEDEIYSLRWPMDQMGRYLEAVSAPCK